MGSSEDMATEKDGKRNSLFDHCKIATNGYMAIITKVDGPCDAPGFKLPSLTLMTELAGQMVNPRSTWVLTHGNSLTHP
jgi:hypothetical protein